MNPPIEYPPDQRSRSERALEDAPSSPKSSPLVNHSGNRYRYSVHNLILTLGTSLGLLGLLGACSSLEETSVDNELSLELTNSNSPRWHSQPDVQTIAEMPKGFNDGVSLSWLGGLFVSNAGNFGPNGLVGTEVFQISHHQGVTAIAEGLNGPLGSVSDWFGNLYISNFNDGTIVRRDYHGEVTPFAALGGAGGGLAINYRGQLFATSYNAQKVYRIHGDGSVSVYSESPLLAGPIGISFGRHGRMFVSNFDDGKILEITANGDAAIVADLGEQAFGNIGYITYSRGCIYATSLNANKVFAVSLSGTVAKLAGTGVFGSVDGSLENAQFALPNGIAANWWGSRLYVSEWGSPNIRTIRLARHSCPDEA